MDDIFDQLLEGDVNISGDENQDEDDEKDTGDDKKMRIVKVERRVVNKRPILDVTRLTGPRGICTIENMAKNIVLKGEEGHEKEDLAKIMALLRHWTHGLYSKMSFEDCIEKIENLGKKRPIQTYLTKMRLGMIDVSDGTTTAEDTLSEALEQPEQPTITDDQKERILTNRMIAEARRAAKLQASSNRPPSSETIKEP